MDLKVIEELRTLAINNPDQKWMQEELAGAERVVKAMDVLENTVNRMDKHMVGKIMFERMTRMHRTLQQNFMGSLLDMIYDYSRLSADMIDDRNRDSWMVAQSMINGIVTAGTYMYKHDMRPQLPLI